MSHADDAFTRYEDDLDFTAGVRVMRAATGTAAEEVLASTAVLLLPPLSLATRRTPVALDWLDEHGFSVEYAHAVRLTDDRIHRIWKYQIADHDADRIRIVSQLLTCGPSLLLAVVGPVRDGVPVATRLCELKGKADPDRTAPHHLRHRLGAANTFNNFVHMPDGPPELLREAAVMLPEQDLFTLWKRAGAVPSGRGREDALSLTPATGLPAGASLTHVAVAFRRNLLERLRAARPAADLAEAERLVDAEAAWVASRSPERPVELLAEFRSRFRPVYPLLRREVDSPEPPLTAFAEAESALFASGFDPARLHDAAEKAGMPLGTRDGIVFNTEWLSLSLRSRELDSVRHI
ncbi:nucleoside-diphosphate kinase [Actinomadura sp. DC4]|uniref:nucleoside-diphosphate kinase n=1 Tax=Actinomadura sp. DC4 TaxID=3055069 RepID=UPI0025B032D9|nr:nucleoside-diphosphate kinase [Actinomadura sp. DC4]MDN3358620.1 nucleoside-diphosphate kinase [Actinomadura sp. DC4]